MRRKDAIKNENTVRLIVFRNGFIRIDRAYTSIPGHIYKQKVKFNLHRQKRKKPQMKKIRFAKPLPPLPF